MKRTISLIIILALLFLLAVPAMAAETSGNCGSNVKWSYDNGTLTISGFGKMQSYRNEEVPWISFRDSITNIVVEEGVTSIGEGAFYLCKNLKTVSLPESLRDIFSNAFEGCSALENITLPSNLGYINAYAFAYCTSLKSITLPKSVYAMSFGAFQGCTSLSSVTFLGAPAMYNKAFADCTALKSITIPEGVTELQYVFCGCTSLSQVKLPSTLTSLYGTFNGCTALKSVEVPEGVENLNSAFYECKSLTNVNIPDSVTDLSFAFSYCSSLKQVDIPDTLTKIDPSAFYGTDLRSIEIPSGVTEIGTLAFYGIKNVSSVVVPEGVTHIGASAFGGCTALRTVTLPASLETIDRSAFYCRLRLNDVYYSGTEEQWSKISIGEKNEHLTQASIHFNYKYPVVEEKPAEPDLPKSGLAYPSTQMITVDGQRIELQAYALKDENGYPTNYVKLRDIAYILNGTPAQFEVGWDGCVAVQKGLPYTASGSEMHTPFEGVRSYTRPNAPTMVNGVAVSLDAVMLADDNGGGYTYYKLRDLGSAIGFYVGWTSADGITIETSRDA